MKKFLFLCLAAVFISVGCTKPEKLISGAIRVSPQLLNSLGPQAALYVIARNAGQTAGPPIAVKRFTQPFNFPLEFTITPQDAMIPDTPFEGSMSVTARISKSGSATPVQKGDLEGTSSPNPVKVGERKLDISIDHERP